MSIAETKKFSGESFCNCFSCSTQKVQVGGEKALEQEVKTEYVVPVSTKLFSDLPARFSYILGSSPVMVICSRWVDWSRFPL